MAVDASRAEMIRRLRLGNLRKLFRDRYRATLPDDDAGREDLYELLLPISVGPNPDLKMRYVIEVWAPWMRQEEAGQLIDRINQEPIWRRKPTAKVLGQRLRLTNGERQRLRLWTIAPCDMGQRGMMWWRKKRRRERMRQLRQLRGAKSRPDYLATSINRAKPWVAAGISRATWYRQQRETSLCQVILTKAEHQPVSPQQPQVPKKSRARKDSQNQRQKPHHNPKKAETTVTDTACELRAHTCLTATEQNGKGGDLRGMPRDIAGDLPA